MSKKFILSSDPLTSDEELRFKDSLSEVIWWHWLPNFWLIKDHNDNYDVAKIRDLFRTINIKARCMVIEVDHKSWAGATKVDSQGRDMTKWLKDHWQTP